MAHEIRYRKVDCPELDAFLAEYRALCEKHGMQFAIYEYSEGGGVLTLEAFDGGLPYLNLSEADSDLPFIIRANAEIEAADEAESAAEEEKKRRIEQEAPADPVIALEGLLRHMPFGYWSDELHAAKSAAEKALTELKQK